MKVTAQMNVAGASVPVKFQFSFERLEAWRKAMEFTDAIYRATRHFPDTERFGLITQLRRAAVSVASNLAEGSSRTSRTDFARYIEIATGSLFEAVTQSEIARRQGYLSPEQYDSLRASSAELLKNLSGLRRSITTPRSPD